MTTGKIELEFCSPNVIYELPQKRNFKFKMKKVITQKCMTFVVFHFLKVCALNSSSKSQNLQSIQNWPLSEGSLLNTISIFHFLKFSKDLKIRIAGCVVDTNIFLDVKYV